MSFLLFKKKYSQVSDKDLLGFYIRNGDMEAFGELFNRYMILIYGICLSILKDREWARDMVIMLFEKSASDVLKFPIRSFKNWIHVVAKNQCLISLRKSKPEFRIKNEFILQFMENEYEMHPLDKEYSYPDIELHKCIEQLKANQKKCIELFYFSNKSYREISVILNTDEKAVKSFIQNGKRNLKICLENRR